MRTENVTVTQEISVNQSLLASATDNIVVVIPDIEFESYQRVLEAQNRSKMGGRHSFVNPRVEFRSAHTCSWITAIREPVR